MRISTLETDSGFDPLARRGGYVVYFEGSRIERCVTADDEQGFVEVVEFENGEPKKATNGEPVTVKAFGRVVIARVDGKWPMCNRLDFSA